MHEIIEKLVDQLELLLEYGEIELLDEMDGEIIEAGRELFAVIKRIAALEFIELDDKARKLERLMDAAAKFDS